MSMMKMGAALLVAAASTALATQPARTAAASQPHEVKPATLTVSIVGPSQVRRNDVCNFTADVVGGTPPYDYRWTGVSGDPFTQSTTSSWSSIGNKLIHVLVTDALGAEADAGKYVTVLTSVPIC